MLSRILSGKLEVDHECEMAYELLRLIKSHSTRSEEMIEYILLMKIKLLIKKLKDSEGEHQERGVSTWYQSFGLSEVGFHDRFPKLRSLIDAFAISPPKDAETPVESPIPISPSSSVGSSSPFRSTTPPPDYPFDKSILDNSLWIIPQLLGSEPVPEKPNESDAC
ncbi:hypothetical protein Tco_0714530 [Tanacetum coccineum]